MTELFLDISERACLCDLFYQSWRTQPASTSAQFACSIALRTDLALRIRTL